MTETKNNKKKRVYISLPISGYDIDERRDTALRMEVKLRGLGYDVFSPLGTQWESGKTTNEYMRIDLKELLDCDAIILMKGWNRSAGCHTELNNAIAIGIDVWFEGMNDIKL